MNKYVFYLFIFFICLFPFSVKAECNENEIQSLKNQVDKIDVSYYINDDAKYYDFDKKEYVKMKGVINIKVSGLIDDFYLVDASSDVTFDSKSFVGDTLIIDSIIDSAKKYNVYSKRCNTLLKTLSLTLPVYNKHRDDPECEGITDELGVCKDFVEEDVNYDSFEEQVEEYKNEVEGSNSNVKKSSSFIDNIVSFVVNNLIFIVVGFVAILVIAIIFIKRFKKRSVLE